MLEVYRWVADESDTFWRSGEDNGSGFESAALGQPGDGLPDVEYLLAGERNGVSLFLQLQEKEGTDAVVPSCNNFPLTTVFSGMTCGSGIA